MKKAMLMMVLLCVAASAQAGCYSEGIRVGIVQKISKKGYVNKSWEGELVMDGVKARGAASTNIWDFSTLSPEVAKVLEDAAMTGKPVALKYCQRNPNLPHLDIDTDYEVVQAVIRG